MNKLRKPEMYNKANFENATSDDICIALDVLEKTAKGQIQMDMQSADIIIGFLNKTQENLLKYFDKVSRRNMQIENLRKIISMQDKIVDAYQELSSRFPEDAEEINRSLKI